MEIIEELAKIIGLYAQGKRDLAEEALLSLGRAVHAARRQRATGGEVEKTTVNAARGEAAMRLFVYWQKQCSHERAKPTPERLRCIIARLKDGYDEGNIRTAIDGAANAAYVSESGHRFDDITLICRNGSKLESFIARGGGPSEEPSGAISEATDLRRRMAAARTAGDQAEYDRLAQQLKGAKR